MKNQYGLTEYALGIIAVSAFLITLTNAIGCQINPSNADLINQCETDMECELAEIGELE